MGLKNAMDPNTIAKTMAKPVQTMSSSQQQNVTLQLSNGLTVREARNMIEQNNERLLNSLSRVMGGA